jgi:hypothetical protein
VENRSEDPTQCEITKLEKRAQFGQKILKLEVSVLSGGDVVRD